MHVHQKITRSVLDLFKKVHFQGLSSCCGRRCSVSTGISQKHRVETLHDDWNPRQVVQEYINKEYENLP